VDTQGEGLIMTTILALTFPLGRYHATPWGRQVNEGAVEIPPSPWRVLRMLYAIWRTRAPELDEEVVHGLLARLAEPPTFHVPRHTPGHTRHYYKTMALKKGQPETDRTLDGFAVFERDADLAIEWPFDLPEAQHAALERIAGSIPYFGRADSVCTGAVPPRWTPEAHETWRPVDAAESVDLHTPATAVLAPVLPLNIPSLLSTPTEVRKAGLPLPPGAHLIGYQQHTPAPIPARLVRTEPRPKVTTVRFSLLQAGLPPETDAVVYTDLLRQAALHRLGRRPEGTVLGGRTQDGGKETANHTHAHFLPLTAGRRLTGLVVWAPRGLPEDELKALTDVRRLHSSQNDSWRATLRVAGIGHITDTAPELVAKTGRRQWHSTTPFTPARFPKRHQTWHDLLRAEIRRELAYRGINTDCDITPQDHEWVTFRRYRPSARRHRDPRQGQARQASAMLKLTFTEPVPGPLALGHLAHFGLGLFHPNRD
jgi:CRISPR-associated protein Csb2